MEDGSDYSDYVPHATSGYVEVVPSFTTSYKQATSGYVEVVPSFTTSYKQATSGYVEVVPSFTTSYKQSTNNDSQSYEMTSRMNRQDKQSGSYERCTAKESRSYGQTHRERGVGPVGVRDEYKRSETIKIGNKSGYTEVYKEERVRDVTYSKNNTSSGKTGSSKRINYY